VRRENLGDFFSLAPEFSQTNLKRFGEKPRAKSYEPTANDERPTTNNQQPTTNDCSSC
jgi:hypothetical protein